MIDTNVSMENLVSSFADKIDNMHHYSREAADVLLNPLETDIASTAYDVVYEEDRIKLKHYRPFADVKKRATIPLLTVYALINRETMLDLQPDRSVVRSLLGDGIDLYMIDWGYPSRKDKFLTIGDHVNGYMDNVVDYIRETHGIDKINIMGICMGGTFSTIYAALHPEKVNALVTTVTPTSFDTNKGLLHIWMREVDADKMVETYGNIPGDLMNFGFLLLNPARLMIDKYHNFFQNLDDKGYVENFVRMERWIFDSPDLPGETFRQFIKDCYQKNLLIQSKMEVDGKRVDLKKITMPVLNFYAKFDHLVPPDASNQLISQIGSTDKEDVCLDTGHIGIYVSGRFQKLFAPRVAQWLKERDSKKKKKARKPVTQNRPKPAVAV
ncbi:MAG: class III poly(R)-hydroxyalkanoic acid synthase subunit PhaC [Deltaproteobacteria bacterium]|nr:MAG: class III poly(R)-hydroxyalkanoic acid synthase subunit PhaC [Deltaproteobacteria bacterium]